MVRRTTDETVQSVKKMERERETLLLKAGSEGIEQAARLLGSGGVVAFPTETVYGLGADALSATAIARVFEAKGRPADNPLIVHLANAEELDRYGVADRRALRIAENLMPGPLTLVLSARPPVPAIARAGLPTVALRIPDHPVALELIARSGPLVAPSANLSGRPSPTIAEHVMRDLSGRIDAVLDGGSCRVGIESTVLDLSGDVPAILRPGGVTPEEIADLIGLLPVPVGNGDRNRPSAPGMKYRHYAPNILLEQVVIHDGIQGEGVSRLKGHLKGGEPALFLLGPDLPREIARLIEAEEAGPLREDSISREFRRGETEGFGRIILVYRSGTLTDALLNRIEKALG